MKKNNNYLILTLLAMTCLAGCDVLDQEPESLIKTSDAIADARSAESALNGLYNEVQSGDLYGGRFIMANEMLAGEAIAKGFQVYWGELDNGNVPSSNFHLQDLWVSAYAAINSANAIIEAVPGIETVDDEDEKRIMGTAYFFRALMHFDLLRQYGEFFDTNSVYGVPVIVEPSLTVSETARSTVADTYAQINLDLDSALVNLSDQSDKFYVSQGAAQALQARVALYQEDFDTAESFATLVIDNSSNYTLVGDYNAVYEIEGSAESIFELNFIMQEDGNVWASEMYINPPEVAVSSSLESFFTDEGESERSALFVQEGSNFRCTKYLGENADDDSKNTILFRLSEMHLIRAEAAARKTGGTAGDALTDINAVRTRAGQTALTGIANETALFDALLTERRAEFAFEGHYWFDLIRLGRMEIVTGRESFRKVMPIPLREMNITDGTLIQNPGYN